MMHNKNSIVVWQLVGGLHGCSNLLYLLLSALGVDLLQKRGQFGNELFIISHYLAGYLR